MVRSLVFALSLLSIGVATADASPLRIAAGEYPPYTSEAMEHYGPINRIVTHASQEAGFEVEFEFLPWKRGLEETRLGRFTASSYWYYSDKRKQDFIHVGPLTEDRIVFMHRKDLDVPSWSSLDDLSGFTIGATNGFTYNEAFWEAAENGTLDVEVAVDDPTNLRKLVAGRLDIIVIEQTLAGHLFNDMLTEQQTENLTFLDRPLQVNPGFLLVSRKIPNADAIASSLQSGLDSIREQGLIDQFLGDLAQTDH
ncbi:MAG: transporter substrate-binding domain-containing protein [Pseudomonadota bacterium]